MAPAVSSIVLLISWLAVCCHGFPVLDQPIYEAPGLPKVDIYYQGGVTSHFDKQLAPLPFVSGSKNSFKKSGDDFRMVTSNEIQTAFEDKRVSGKHGIAREKPLKEWTASGVDDSRQAPRVFGTWVFFAGDSQES